jgi:integrase
MKYVKQIKTKLYFQRAIPTQLRAIAGKANFSRPLELDAATATEQEILEARIEAQRMYDLYLKTMENTSADAYAENEIEALAADVLRRNKATAGQYAKHMLGPKLQDNHWLFKHADEDMNIKQSHYASMAVPEYLELMMKLNDEGKLKTTLTEDKTDLIHTPTRKLTAQEAAVLRAWETVQKVNRETPRTVSSLWRNCLEQKHRIDPSVPIASLSKNDRRRVRRFEYFMKYCPDIVIAAGDSTAQRDVIQQAIDDMVIAEEQLGKAHTTILRSLAEVISGFNWAIKRYRLNWARLEMPTIEPSAGYVEKTKQVLLTPQQVQFYNAAVDADTPLAAALLLMLHCGAMPTEIARLRIDTDLFLEHQKYPYVSMQGGVDKRTKTKARPRFVPIVFGLDLIKRRLPEAIEMLATREEPSGILNDEIRRITDNRTLTGHCLRHTFKMQTNNKLMSPEITYAIAGWSGGWINRTANQYGSAGFGENEQLETLSRELARVFEAIVEVDKQRQAEASNVLPFSPPR